MNPTASPKSAHVITRLVSALFAIAFVAALVVEIVTALRTGQVPTVGNLIGGLAALPGAFLFGFHALKGGGNGETGVLSEPSEKVRNLALRPGSKVEAIKAYREETGVDVKRAIVVVERLASTGRSEPVQRFL